ncbi:MAG: tail fiber domain-containing protein [Myxococcota bacterium]|nr:tail fiber domain-containing protein [Myxococcota bacterium]
MVKRFLTSINSDCGSAEEQTESTVDEKRENSRRQFLTYAGFGAAGLLAAGNQQCEEGLPLAVKGIDLSEDDTRLHHRAHGCTVLSNIDSELKNYAGMADGQIVYVAGYYNENDGGGGFFQWIEGDQAADDGGTVINSNIGQGRWKRIYQQGTIHVKWFGVTADGFEDDTQAFQRVVDFVNALIDLDEPDDPEEPTITVKLPSSPIFLRPTSTICFEKQKLCLTGPEAADTYIYTTNRKSAGFIIERNNQQGTVSNEAAITFVGRSQIARNFIILPGAAGGGFVAGLDTCTYNGIFENIRIRGFQVAHRVYRYSDERTEAINNQFKSICGYPEGADGIGLIVGNVDDLPNDVSFENNRATNENTWTNCRYRGTKHCLWLYNKRVKISSQPELWRAKSYGNLFINCIFQETTPSGVSIFELLKIEGKGVEGVTFLNGRFEAKRNGSTLPQLSCGGIAPQSNFVLIGSYIHSDIHIEDPEQRVNSLGRVGNSSWHTHTLEATTLEATTIEATTIEATTIAERTMSTAQSLRLESHGGMEFASDVGNSSSGGDFLFSSDGNHEVLRLVGRNGGLLPGADGQQNLGYSSKRWYRVYAKNGTIQTSDRNEKTAIEPENLGLEFINALKPVQFRWKKGGGVHHGLIAQEFKDTLDALGVEHAAYSDADGTLGICYTELISSLIKSVQELSQKVTELQKKQLKTE